LCFRHFLSTGQNSFTGSGGETVVTYLQSAELLSSGSAKNFW
jgi:hypothetical protein